MRVVPLGLRPEGKSRRPQQSLEAGWAGVDGFSTPDKHRLEATVFLEHKQYRKAETFICNWETFIL